MVLFDRVNFPDEPADAPQTREEELEAENEILRAELTQLRADLANVTAERDALAAESDAVHRAINVMCGTDTSTIEAVQQIINERNELSEQLKQYQRMAARR